MNKKVLTILGITLIVGIILVALLVPSKEVKYDEELLGVNYNIKGNETKLDFGNDNPIVAIDIEKYGSVIMELYPDIAPNTVNNFISLIKSGFYDNSSFHRLVPGFVLQGGDPDGTGTGGPGYTIKGEFTNNGFENNLKHDKWVVSMARGSDNDSAGSQFFICLDNANSLDGDYASFGKVIDGFKLLEKIEQEETSDQDSGKLQTNLVIKKVLIDLKGREYPEVEKNSEN